MTPVKHNANTTIEPGTANAVVRAFLFRPSRRFNVIT